MIKQFIGQYRFLSNFYEVPRIQVYGCDYSSAEAAYQSCKLGISLSSISRRQRFSTMSASQAKREGRRVKSIKDWDLLRVGVMMHIVRAKFYQNPKLAEKLIETFPHRLVEGNTWGDTFWGRKLMPDGELAGGQNWLGRILMVARSEQLGLQRQKDTDR